MVRSKREYEGDEEKGDGCDRADRPFSGDVSEDYSEISGSDPIEASDDGRTSGGIAGGLPARVRDVLRIGAEGDLSRSSADVENEIIQWIRALDLQIIGGCRADERLKPLLKLNVSSGAADDQFMAQLIQHFEASEITVLARCLCLPLVSVRVGKIIKKRNMLCPTSTRGFLSLTLLPSSHMRISFTGDDGCIERLALVGNGEYSFAIIEEILADTSGRSFLLRLPSSQVMFFWCSDKFKSDGMELISKMKDLLRRKPSLSDLTGISGARLHSFATHLRAYLLTSANASASASATSSRSFITPSDRNASGTDLPSPRKSSSIGMITAKISSMAQPIYETSLSPRSNTFKDDTSKNSGRNSFRDKVRRLGDSSIMFNPSASSTMPTNQCMIPNEGVFEANGSRGSTVSRLSNFPSLSMSFNSSFSVPSLVSNQSSLFSPYYCWCPPFPTPLHYNTTTHLPNTSNALPLPPLSTLLSAAAPPESSATSKLPICLPELPPLKFPALLSCPVSSVSPLPSSQNIPTFTPFMSDPIVHIPVIDVCSSGQGYLVSAGPAISSAIPPLPISHVSRQLIPPGESLAEKNARETLRMLMASAPTSATPKLFNVLPEVLNSMGACGPGTSVPGSRSLCCFAADVESIRRDKSSSDDVNDDEVSSDDSDGCNPSMDDVLWND
ncbi:hypothetical protein AXF42_Ash008236 [Apostasia shenzhenica]|uniref:Uncharacterized protein n=1 Tax=Apostasia shenzhenica TaxID=1088818 RepID=A0A2I0A8Z5_9ASPA|nr:hypothetical protein AXF42_Ash008236 [Apostasia shenzhenica]